MWTCAGEGRAEEEAGGDTAQPEEAMRAVINGDLALFAFGGVLEALPGSLPLHRKTLEALRPLSCRSPAASRVLEAAYDSLQRNFTTSPEAWDLRACRPVPASLLFLYHFASFPRIAFARDARLSHESNFNLP